MVCSHIIHLNILTDYGFKAAFTALNAVAKVIDAETRTKELQVLVFASNIDHIARRSGQNISKSASTSSGEEMGWSRTSVHQPSDHRSHSRTPLKKGPPTLELYWQQPGVVIVDSPQCRLQRLVLKNYAQFIMDVLPTRTAQTVDQMLPVALKFFAEVFLMIEPLTSRHYAIARMTLQSGFKLRQAQENSDGNDSFASHWRAYYTKIWRDGLMETAFQMMMFQFYHQQRTKPSKRWWDCCQLCMMRFPTTCRLSSR